MDSNICEVIRKRYSCRTYRNESLREEHIQTLSECLAGLSEGPFGSFARFKIIASQQGDQEALKGLGAYGSVWNPQGFIVGAIENKENALTEYGYLLEQAVLKATEIVVGTCWIGGIFTRSRFAQRINLEENEIMPAIISLGYEEEDSKNSFIRRYAKGHTRLPFEQLFFDKNFNIPLTAETSGKYAQVLEMVRLAPSASNKQPWRVVRIDNMWHFYLQRTKGYGKGSLLFAVLRLPDLQKVDIGIAMCHFELTARTLGLTGNWIFNDPGIPVPERTEYIVTWKEE